MEDKRAELQERGLDEKLIDILVRQKPVSVGVVTWSFIIVALLWFVIGMLPWIAQEGFDLSWGLRPEQASLFGDSFGFVNSLFSSLALAGVVVAIFMQRQELAEQRQELIITQWEVSRGAKAQQDASEAQEKQAQTNLNAAILSSLQGMHDFGMSQLEARNEQTKEGGRNAIQIAQELRTAVLANMLNGGDLTILSKGLSKTLQEWADVTAIIDRFRGLKHVIQSTRYTQIEDFDHGGVREIEIEHPEDVDTTNLNMIIWWLVHDLNVVRDALIRRGERLDEFDQWREMAIIWTSGDVPDDGLDQLRELCKLCNRILIRAASRRDQGWHLSTS